MTNYDKSTGTSGTLRMAISYSQSQSGNYTLFDTTFYLINSSGPTFANGLGWSGKVAGSAVSGSVNVAGSGTYKLGSWIDQKRTHDSNGNLSAQAFSLSIEASGTSGLGGPTTVSTSITPPRIPKAPSTPGKPTFSNIAATSVTVSWAASSNNGGDAIDGYLLRRNTKTPVDGSGYVNVSTQNNTSRSAGGLSPATQYYFAVYARNGSADNDGYSDKSADGGVVTLPVVVGSFAVGTVTTNSVALSWNKASNGAALSGYRVEWSTHSDFTVDAQGVDLGTATTYTVTPLTPGTPYYFRVRPKTSSGNGPWSPTLTQATLPSVPPGFTVVAGASGKTATLTLTAPAGSKPDYYTVNMRVKGQTAVQVFTVVQNPTGGASSLTISGLTPGTVYEWQAAAVIGTYTTPYTAWIPVQQPRPNTSPGDYFDGSTASTPDTVYSWDGTANLSTSKATGKHPTGWTTFTSNPVPAGATGVVSRVTGSVMDSGGQDFSAQATFFTGSAAPGFFLGGDKDATVSEGGQYTGSVYASPSKAQSLAAAVIWKNAAGATLGTSVGTPSVIAANMTGRLAVTDIAPAGAVSASVGAIDVLGDGWVPWSSGDAVELDGAMLNVGDLLDYFDGSTADTSLYDYDWTAAPNASTSQRETLVAGFNDPLQDPDCPPIPQPPEPPAISDDCIIPVGEWRRYWAVIPPDLVTKWVDLIPTIAITTGAEETRQVRIRVYANPDNLDPSAYVPDVFESEQIVSYIPAETTLTVDGVSERAWADVAGYSTTLAADHLLYGSDSGPATWPTIACGIGYLIAFDVPLGSPIGNIAVAVSLTRRYL